MRVVTDLAVPVPHPPRHPRSEVTPKKVETLPAFTQTDHTGLVRMQLQPLRRQNVSGRLQGRLGLTGGPAHDHEVVGEPDQHPGSDQCYLPIKGCK